MSAIPYPLDPLASSDKSWFTITVKPGILTDKMEFNLAPYWNTVDGYCYVEWGDRTSEAAENELTLKHTYTTAGTYTVRIKGNCYKCLIASVNSGLGLYMVYDTNANWDALGKLTHCPRMFNGCKNMVATIHSLPQNLVQGLNMFTGCRLVTISLDTLAANAPAEGWPTTDISYMFYNAGSGNSPGTVTGSRSAFLAKLPNVLNIGDAFTNTNTT